MRHATRKVHKTTINTVTFKQSKYIEANSKFKTDTEIAETLGIPSDIVCRFRYFRLGIVKNRVVRRKLGYTIVEIYDAKKELDALISYQYKGIMLESVHHRIDFLFNMIDEYKKNCNMQKTSVLKIK